MTNAANLLAALPTADTVRWTPKKKAAVVVAIAEGALAEADALATYNLTASELNGWRDAMAFAGSPALRVTRMQAYPRFA